MDKDSSEDKIESIKADIRQGKEYRVIALKWETSVDYVKNIANKMRKDGENVPDRRSRKWKIMQLIRKENIEEYEE